jgi:murein DD-endopeptidase MepM/ murein hydrolase activator NlpD
MMDGDCPCCPHDLPEAPAPRAGRRGFLLGAALAGTGMGTAGARQAEATDAPLLAISPNARQSGTLLGRTVPGARVMLDDIVIQPDAAGRFLVGFDRDAAPSSLLSVQTPDGRQARNEISVTPREYVVRRINGLPSATVNPPDNAMARIRQESALKQRAFASVDDRETGFLETFDWPLASIRVTSPWGAQRALNGALQRPHYGVDLGSPTGTPIKAPAGGIVIMAEADLFYEGGMVSLDHGQGLMTTYLHMSRVDVRVGQRLARGTQLGQVGARGRATGPHLCWRMRWRGRQLDPTLKLSS